VSRLRLVGMKAFGVMVVATLALLVLAVVGVLAGWCWWAAGRS
jgi:ABC-2 type transport system permease protein